jgi:hypothetical protein
MSITTLSTGPGRLLKDALLLALTLTFTACAWSSKAKGTAVGAATGAAVGGVIGNQTGSTARGAIIGAAVGGTAGALIGHRMDQQAKELEYLIPGAVNPLTLGLGIARLDFVPWGPSVAWKPSGGCAAAALVLNDSTHCWWESSAWKNRRNPKALRRRASSV